MQRYVDISCIRCFAGQTHQGNWDSEATIIGFIIVKIFFGDHFDLILQQQPNHVIHQDHEDISFPSY